MNAKRLAEIRERAIDLVKVCKASGNFEENLPLFIAQTLNEAERRGWDRAIEAAASTLDSNCIGSQGLTSLVRALTFREDGK